MQQIKSNFVNPAGLAVIAVLALLSAYFGIDLLFAVLMGAFFVCLVSWLWTRSALNRLKFGSDRSEVCGFPGDELQVKVSLTNDKLLPVVWLRADLAAGEGDCVASDTEDPAVFSWVMPHQSLDWTERLGCVRRGVREFTSVETSSGDGFGLSEASKSLVLERPFRAVVFPSLMDVDVSRILSRLSELEASRKGFYSDPTLIKSVRDYSGGDSFKDINWRLLARGDKMLVNVKEKMDVRRTCLILDIESFSVTEEIATQAGTRREHRLLEKEFEHMLSLAASVAAKLSNKGVVCSLVIPGYLVKKESSIEHEARAERVILPDESASQAEILLTALAEIDYHGGPAKFPLEQISAEYHKLGQPFCFASSRRRAQDKLELALPAAVWYVLPEDDGSGRVIEETELLR